MKRIKTFAMFEVIKVPIKVGDTVLGGRFKNKKIVVKKIGKNPKGDITINGKPLLKFRIIKENHLLPNEKLEQLIRDCLLDLSDDGFRVDIFIDGDLDEVRITKKGDGFRISEVAKSIVDLSSHLRSLGTEANIIHYKLVDDQDIGDNDDGWRTKKVSGILSIPSVNVSVIEIFISQQQS